ncbi:AmmeMemoRadiSam system protein B [Arhodomonas sp. SL1]|uniref:AmmeMemoRadiSam system protein B n=1 Tax=Arhodomonas sp. SL1 TaxID=3425691 RepID=UPI003F8853E3
METERPAAVAGAFYSGDAESLGREVDTLLAQAPVADGAAPKAIISPHAGFMYSGTVAALLYARLKPVADEIRRVVLMGPSHFVPFDGIAAPAAERFRTPLGAVPVDSEAMAVALAQPGVHTLDAAHAREHSLETQLPFLQRALGDLRIVPLVTGGTTPEQTGAVLEALWGGPETLVVISSDLSHFHDDTTARRLDRTTAQAVEALDVDALDYDSACGRDAIRGLLWVARRHGGRVHTVALRNSADAGAPPDRVVGYGAFTVEEAA